FFQAEDGIRDYKVTGVQTCALPISAQRVLNSRWLKEVERINSVHRMYRPEKWRDLRHFIFWFHDSTCECLAVKYKVEIYRMSMRSEERRVGKECRVGRSVYQVKKRR